MCHRRPLLLLVPLVCLLVVVGGISNIDMIHGEFKTKDGSKCAWYELKESEDNVTIGIGCHCRTERGSGQGYTCHYFGDPSHCQAYSQDPRKFYTEIIEHIEENVHSACDQETVSHDSCPDNVYTREEHSPPEVPCFPHEKERYEL
jgi:hypothetical protein